MEKEKISISVFGINNLDSGDAIVIKIEETRIRSSNLYLNHPKSSHPIVLSNAHIFDVSQLWPEVIGTSSNCFEFYDVILKGFSIRNNIIEREY